MVGVPLVTLRVNVPLVPVDKAHAWWLPLVSPNSKWPIVRLPSRVTVRSAAMLIVLKSAILLVPLAGACR